MRRLQAVVIAAILVAAEPALAHSPLGIGGFYGGLLHPVLVPAHALALAGLGLLVGQQAPAHRRALVAIFAAGVLAGIGAIVAAVAFAEGALVLLAVAALSGLLVAVARPLPAIVSAPLAVVTGVTLGLDSPPEEISIVTSLIALAGTLIGATLVLVLIVGVTAERSGWRAIGARILGSWIAASAILVLALQLAR